MWCWRINAAGGRTSLERLALPRECSSLDQASLLLPGGTYTTFRTYKGCCALELGKHLQRLEDSAWQIGRGERIRAEQIRTALGQALGLAQVETGAGVDLRFRLTLDLENQTGAVIVCAERLHTPPLDAYRDGVRTISTRLKREQPAAKLTGFISLASAARQSLPAGIHEALMVDEHGRILEGLGSNFFAVRGGGLSTAGEGVLPGITRSLVLESAQRLGIDVIYEAVALNELGSASEAFITSSSRGVLPVVQVDGRAIGTGKPGLITQRIGAEFERVVEDKLESIYPRNSL